MELTSNTTEFIISIITIISAYYIGNKSVWGQRLAMLANLGWWFYVVAFQRWGFIPMEIMFTVIVVRNLIKWEKDEKRVNEGKNN